MSLLGSACEGVGIKGRLSGAWCHLAPRLQQRGDKRECRLYHSKKRWYRLRVRDRKEERKIKNKASQ